ncbi:MAG: hypothetical protein QXK06_04580 [Candidatus Diapherotrites archaeon]
MAHGLIGFAASIFAISTVIFFFLTGITFILLIFSLLFGFNFPWPNPYLDFFALGGFFSLEFCLVFAGIERVLLARLIRKKETSSILMLEKGLNEVSGTVVPLEGKTVVSPLSGKNCVYYSYKIEREGIKDWHTVKEEVIANPFLLKDSSGQILVLPEDAEMQLAGEIKKKGKERHSEQIICPGDRLFAVGVVDDAGRVSKEIGVPFSSKFVLKKRGFFFASPCIISNQSKETLLKELKDESLSFFAIAAVFPVLIIVVALLEWLF